MTFCLCYQQTAVLKKNDGFTIVEKTGSYLNLLEAFIHPDKAIVLTGAALVCA